jgi:hypothetical protein
MSVLIATITGAAAGRIAAAAAVGRLEQTSFRVRNDDGTQTSATWADRAGLSALRTQAVTFRLRVSIRNYHASASVATGFKLQYSREGSSWTDVTASSSVIKAVAGATVTDGTVTTDQLGGLTGTTFVAGTVDAVDGAWPSITLAAGRRTELEATLQIVSGDITDGDQVALRIVRSAGTVLDRYTRYIPITATTATPQTFISDTFNRTVAAGGWGSADSGTDSTKAWTIVQGASSAFSVDGTAGAITTGFTNARAVTGDSNSADVEAFAEFNNLNTPDDFSDVGLILRYTDSTHSYAFDVTTVSSVVKLRVRDWNTGDLASATVAHNVHAKMRARAVTSGGNVTLSARWWEGSAVEPGTWDVTFTHNTGTRNLSGRAGVILSKRGGATPTVDNFSVQSVGVVVPFIKPVVKAQRLYGFHLNLNNFAISEYPTRLGRSAAASAQMLRHALDWSQIQTTSGGAYDWSRTDAVVAQSDALGIRTMLTIWQSPTWANGGADTVTIPAYPSATWNSWLSGYQTMVAAAVARYGGSNILWEMWNEPNLLGFWKSQASAAPKNDTNWAIEYTTWHEAIRSTILSVDPHAIMGSYAFSTFLYIGAESIPGETFMSLCRANGITTDIISGHFYDNSDQPAPGIDVAFQGNFTDIARCRTALNGVAQDKLPMWATEWGWGIGVEIGVDATVQATYLTTAFGMLRDTYTYVSTSTWFLQEDPFSYGPYGVYDASSSYAARPSRDAFVTFTGTL